MKVRVKNRYLDIVLETIKEPGEEFDTTPERAELLARKGHVEIIEDPTPAAEEVPAMNEPTPAAEEVPAMNEPTPAADPKEEKPKPAPKKTTRKKKTE